MNPDKSIIKRLRIRSNFLFFLGACFIVTSIIGLVFSPQPKKIVDITKNSTTVIQVPVKDTGVKSGENSKAWDTIVKADDNTDSIQKARQHLDSLINKKEENERKRDTAVIRSRFGFLIKRISPNFASQKLFKNNSDNADSLYFFINQINKLLNTKGRYFTDAVNETELNRLQGYFNRWIVEYRIKKYKPGDIKTGFKPDPFPQAIANKIINAYDK